MESLRPVAPLLFSRLQSRLIEAVNTRIDNGEFTERGLARFLSVSQPQIHNVLKGARKLSPELADVMLMRLEISILDLLTPEEIAALGPVKRPPGTERGFGTKTKYA